MFRVCEMTAFCIRRRISPPQALNSSVIASTTSLDHPPRTSVMMLYCQMSCPGNGCLGSQWGGGGILGGLLFLFLFSVHSPRAAHFYCQNSLIIIIIIIIIKFYYYNNYYYCYYYCYYNYKYK